MNIGVNARTLLFNPLEGIPRYIYETTVEMAKNHPEDTFILYYDRPITNDLPFPANVQKKVLHLPSRHPLLWFLWFEILIPRALKRDKIDVFYSGDGYISLRTSVPQIMVTHDLAYLHYPEHIPASALMYFRMFVRKFHQKANAVIAVSEATKLDIIRQYGIPENKITVVYNAVSLYHPDDGMPKSLKKDITDLSSPFFFFIGALHPRKNIINMCEAFHHFKLKTNFPHKLVIAGRYAWKSEKIRNKVESTPDVIYIGTVGEDEKYFLYKKSTALLYLSLFEGFGIPILEAMSSQTPVITSNISSMPEVAGEAAILADPMNVDEIAVAMELICDPAVREKFKMAGSKRVQHFTWSASASVIYSLLKKHNSLNTSGKTDTKLSL
jgi:glycosyltransferase involved in cell wall biosynthesis